MQLKWDTMYVMDLSSMSVNASDSLPQLDTSAALWAKSHMLLRLYGISMIPVSDNRLFDPCL